MSEFDLLLSGGTLIDGTGAPRREADVAVQGDRIVEVGKLDGAAARRVIDARGLIVAPGLIDVHNHSDGWLLVEDHLVSKTAQGFTTEVLMSDGISYAPVSPATAPHWLHYLRSLNGLRLGHDRGWRTIGDYMAQLDRRTVHNSVAQIPYANVRVLSCGWGRRPPDDQEMRLIQQEIRRGMEDGAAGLSTGLDYIAQCFATTDELVEACSAMREYGGIYVTHVRYKKGLLPALREAVEIGRRAGVGVHISHLKSETAETTDDLLAYIDREATQQVDFTFDVYPYLPGSTMLNSLLPYDAWEDGPLGVVPRLACPELRRRFAETLVDYRTPLNEIRIAWVGSQSGKWIEGLSLAAYIDAVGRSPADALADLLIDEHLAVLCVFHRGDDRLVEPMLRHPKFMLGSDGIYFPGGRIHPRQYGSAPRLLGPLVRDRAVMTLEQAVHRASGFSAARFGLTDRGVVRAGNAADLFVFDADTIGDRATYDNPHQLAAGVGSVFVGGVEVISNGQAVADLPSELPGRALRCVRSRAV